MSYSKVEYIGNGVSTVFTIPFSYIDREHINAIDTGNTGNTFTFINDQNILMSEPVADGDKLIIKRITPVDQLLNYFDSASVLEGKELDADFLQALFSLQEIKDVLVDTGQDITEFLTDINMNGFKITNLGDADENEDYDAANVKTVKSLIEKYSNGNAITENLQIAIPGQTDFILPFTYNMGTNALAVYIAGVRQSSIHITELTENSFRIGAPCEGDEEVYTLISDQPASSIEVPQATTKVLGGGKFATVADIDAEISTDKLVSPALMSYAISKIDIGNNVDNGVLAVENDIKLVPQGKYYVLDFELMQDPPSGLFGQGVIQKINGFNASQGGMIIAYDENGNVAVNVKVSTLWQGWKKINQSSYVSTLSPDDNDGRVDGTVYYEIE